MRRQVPTPMNNTNVLGSQQSPSICDRALPSPMKLPSSLVGIRNEGLPLLLLTQAFEILAASRGSLPRESCTRQLLPTQSRPPLYINVPRNIDNLKLDEACCISPPVCGISQKPPQNFSKRDNLPEGRPLLAPPVLPVCPSGKAVPKRSKAGSVAKVHRKSKVSSSNSRRKTTKYCPIQPKQSRDASTQSKES